MTMNEQIGADLARAGFYRVGQLSCMYSPGRICRFDNHDTGETMDVSLDATPEQVGCYWTAFVTRAAVVPLTVGQLADFIEREAHKIVTHTQIIDGRDFMWQLAQEWPAIGLAYVDDINRACALVNRTVSTFQIKRPFI